MLRFRQGLFLWRPRMMFDVHFKCRNKDVVKGTQLPVCTSDEDLAPCGFNPTVRDVYTMKGTFYFAQEQLRCKSCGKKFSTGDPEMMAQVKVQWRRLMTFIPLKMFGCGDDVLAEMRGAAAGSNFSLIRENMHLLHSAQHLQRVAQYNAECKVVYARREKVKEQGQKIPDDPKMRKAFGSLYPEKTYTDRHVAPPKMHFIPGVDWFIGAYKADWDRRELPSLLPAIAAVPCTEYLRMDSTATYLKHLSSTARKHVNWVTNLMNMDGLLLQSVFTQGEGVKDLWRFADGFMLRVHYNGDKPPVLLFVDNKCCEEHYNKLFDPDRLAELTDEERAAWRALKIVLDVYHLMHRLNLGLTSTGHEKAGLFMTGLSSCIFQLDPDDLETLRDAYARRLRLETGNDEDYKEFVDYEITKQDLQRFVRFRLSKFTLLVE